MEWEKGKDKKRHQRVKYKERKSEEWKEIKKRKGEEEQGKEEEGGKILMLIFIYLPFFHIVDICITYEVYIKARSIKWKLLYRPE